VADVPLQRRRGASRFRVVCRIETAAVIAGDELTDSIAPNARLFALLAGVRSRSGMVDAGIAFVVVLT